MNAVSEQSGSIMIMIHFWICMLEIISSFDPDYKYFYAPDGFPGPMAYNSQPDYLYHNNGDGTFTDVTKEMGIIDKDGQGNGCWSC